MHVIQAVPQLIAMVPAARTANPSATGNDIWMLAWGAPLRSLRGYSLGAEQRPRPFARYAALRPAMCSPPFLAAARIRWANASVVLLASLVDFPRLVC